MQKTIDVSNLEYQFIEMGDNHPDEDEIVKREDELINFNKTSIITLDKSKNIF